MCMMAHLGCTTDGRHLGPLSKGIPRTPHQRLPKDEADHSTFKTSTSCLFDDSWQCLDTRLVFVSLKAVAFNKVFLLSALFGDSSYNQNFLGGGCPSRGCLSFAEGFRLIG